MKKQSLRLSWSDSIKLKQSPCFIPHISPMCGRLLGAVEQAALSSGEFSQAVFSLFPLHKDRKTVGSCTQLYKPNSLYMQNIVIGSMFSHRATLRVNEIMTTAALSSLN